MRFSKTAMVLSLLYLLVLLMLLAPRPGAAVDLGVIGPVYPIAEESALDAILHRLQAMERSGELRRLRQGAISRSLNSIKAPPPVDGIGTAVVRAQRRLDPTVHYASAVTTELGQVVVPAGARINPLRVMRLTQRLVFFDGRDAQQAEAVRRMVNQASSRIKPILVAGSWYDTSKAWKVLVYYDQQGKLCRRFGIAAVPSVVSQFGDQLLIEEVPAKELQ